LYGELGDFIIRGKRKRLSTAVRAFQSSPSPTFSNPGRKAIEGNKRKERERKGNILEIQPNVSSPAF
jgi:hypothetical protein